MQFNQIVLRACEANEQKRYPTAEKLQADLVLLQGGKSIRRLRRLEQRWKFFRNVGISFALVLVLGLVAALISQRASEAGRRAAEFNRIVAAMQARRFSKHATGWSDTNWNSAAELARLQKNAAARNQAAAGLIGLEARWITRQTNTGGSSIVFATDGETLLLGGRALSYGVENASPSNALTRLWRVPLIRTGLQPGEPGPARSAAASAASLATSKPLKRLRLDAPSSTGLKPDVNERLSEPVETNGLNRGSGRSHFSPTELRCN